MKNKWEPGMLVFGVKITRREAVGETCLYINSGFTNTQTMDRWMWFFRYKAAIAQIEKPRQKVELHVFSYEAKNPKDVSAILKNRISAAKGKVTKATNEIDYARELWKGKIWPIENEPGYIKMLGKLETAKLELKQLTDQLP